METDETMTSFSIPSVLPILPLPLNQVLYPGLVLSIQIVRSDSIALLQSLIKVAEKGGRSKNDLIIGCAPTLPLGLARKESRSSSGVLQTKDNPFTTPPASDEEEEQDSSSNSEGRPAIDEIFNYATAARIIRLERISSSVRGGNATGFLAVVQGLSRITIDEYTNTKLPFYSALVTVLPATSLPPSIPIDFLPSLSSTSTTLLHALAITSSPPPISTLLSRRLQAFVSEMTSSTAANLIDILVASIPVNSSTSLTLPDKLLILSTNDSYERIERGIEIFVRLIETLDLKKRIGERVGQTINRRQREFLLLQQLEAIKSELDDLAGRSPAGVPRKGGRKGNSVSQRQGGSSSKKSDAEEEEEEEDDLVELERQIKAKTWTEESRKVAFKELKRLKKSPPQGAEFGVIRNYIDTLLSLPWNESTPTVLSRDFVAAARKKLDEDHHGLEPIKKRLLEWLAVLRLKQEKWDAASGTDSTSQTKAERLEDSLALLDDSPLPALLPTPLASVDSRQPRDKGPILLLCGPPGVGKTSIARSLATAMGRKFYRISLGGIRDEAEIRGHRRTYVGAMAGSLVMALKKTGVINPVILLDEIDKLGKGGNQGDPEAALLEVLDPEQNWCFTDHYLGIPVDLSGVLFIATANSLDTISEPLYDRMETIELSGYAHEEKLIIARKYLLTKQIESNALPSSLFQISDKVLLELITSYTREAGVRSLEREIGAVVRAKAVEYSEARDRGVDSNHIVSNNNGNDITEARLVENGYKVEVTSSDLERFLGVPKYEAEMMDRESLVGVSTGLAYQGSGNGGILHIESTSMPGTGGFHLTGQLGSVISESATLAFAWVKSHAYELGISVNPTEDVFKKIDVHVHLPSGSVKKDGPSAGVAFTVAIVSLMRSLKVIKGLAMTGEITLRGNVTPVGGIKEKLLGAHRAGIRTLVLPYKNRKDVTIDLPDSVKHELTIIYVRTIWEALEAAFGGQLWDGLRDRRNGGASGGFGETQSRL